MAIIDDIRDKFIREEYEFSRHAVDQTILREITIEEICQVMNVGEIIEDYPDDKYDPSCLIFGITKESRPLHIQCSYPTRSRVKVITVYEPDPTKWIDFRIRR